jgi:hypothetical protein
MKTNRTNIINIPLEFKIACLVQCFDERAVLQTFIDHISFYTELSKDYSKGYREATYALSEYILPNSRGQPSKAFAKSRELCSQCILGILKIGFQKGNFKKKQNKSQPLIKTLFKAMEKVYSTDKLYLDEDRVIYLNEDFQLLCELHNHYPSEYLEYFMSKIDLADHTTCAGLNKVTMNSSMAFFAMLMNGSIDANVHNPTKPATPLEIEFIDKIQQFHAKVFIIRSFAKRKSAYHQFFLEYYNQTNKPNN